MPCALAAWSAALIGLHASWQDGLRLGIVLTVSGVLLACVLVLVARPHGSALRNLPLHVALSAVIAGAVLIHAAVVQQGHHASGWTQAVEGDVPFSVILRMTSDPQLLERPGFDGEQRLMGNAVVLSAELPGDEAPTEVGADVVLIFSLGEHSTDPNAGEIQGISEMRDSEDAQVPVAGERYQITVRAAPTGPGERTSALLFPFGTEIVPLPEDRMSGFTAVFNELRTATSEASQHAVADAPALLPGLILGDRSLQDAELTQAMLDSGLSHLTAVSGANCALIMGSLMGLVRLLRLPRVCSVPISLAGLVLFVFLVHPEPSVIRAGVMGSIGAIALFAGRGRASFSLLCLCVLLLLLYDPWYSLEPAFQLSVAATSGIVLVGTRIKDLLAKFMPAVIAAPLALAFSAQLFVTPVLLPLSEAVNTYAVPANLLGAPFVPFITVPGTFAAVISTVFPPLAVSILWCSGWAAAAIGLIGRSASSLPQAMAPWPEGWLGAVLVIVYIVATLVMAHLLISRKSAGSFHSTALGLAAGSMSALVVPVSALTGSSAMEGWSIALCDVGQGDMVVIRTGERAGIVVDTGEEPDAADGCLKELQVETVDVLMLTHEHQDHIGGVPGVVQGREVSEVLYSASAGWDAEAALSEVLPADGQLIRAEPGDAGVYGVGSQYRVEYQVWAAADHHPNPNDNSLLVLFEVMDPSAGEGQLGSAEDPWRILTTGDLESEVAASLIQAGDMPHHVDILKVGHHGAENSGTQIIEFTDPQVALIGVGEENSYGHPAQLILTALGLQEAAVYRTDLHGTVLLTLREGTVAAEGL